MKFDKQSCKKGLKSDHQQLSHVYTIMVSAVWQKKGTWGLDNFLKGRRGGGETQAIIMSTNTHDMFSNAHGSPFLNVYTIINSLHWVANRT